MEQPRPASPGDRLAWAKALTYGGRIEEAAREADALVADDDARIAFDARILAARARLMLRHTQEAIAALRAASPATTDDAALRDAYLARALANDDEHGEATALADALLSRVGELRPSTQRVVRATGLHVCLIAGRIAKARAIAESATWLPSPIEIAARAALTAESGALGEVEPLLARAEGLVAPTHSLRAYTALVRIRTRTAAGDFAGVDAQVDASLAHNASMKYGDQYPWAMIEARRLAIARGRGALPEWATGMPMPSGPTARFLDAYARVHAARSGASSRGGLHGDARPDAGEVLDARVACLLAEAEEAIAAGDAARGVAVAEQAVALARASGLVLYEADALATLGDALVVAGRAAEAAEPAESLTALAASAPSARWQTEGTLLASIARAHVPDGALLERIAAQGDVAPVSARRARAVLEPTRHVDALDRLVVAAARARWGGASFDRIDGGAIAAPDSPWRAGWGLDPTRRAAWLPNGELRPLSEQLWRFLEAMAERGGKIDRDAIACDVLGLRDYHKLRDATRIKVAARRAREAIEDQPSNPTRVVTTDEGYAFGASPVRCLVLSKTPDVPQQ
jgi:hypothetical protein